MKHRPSRPLPASLLLASIGLIGCTLETGDEPDDRDDASELAPAELAPLADLTAAGPVHEQRDPDLAAAPAEPACPEGQACGAAVPAPQARFTTPERPAPTPAREDHSARKRPTTAADLGDSYKNLITLKFVEGSGVRARDGGLDLDLTAVAGPAPRAALAALRGELRRHGRVAVVPLHHVDEATLLTWKRDGEQATGQPLPDLNLWQQIFVEVDSDDDLADLIDALNRHSLVELAYAAPLPAPPPGATPEAAAAFTADARAHDRMPWPTDRRLAQRVERTTAATPVTADAAPPASLLHDDDDPIDDRSLDPIDDLAAPTARHHAAIDDLAQPLPGPSAVLDYTASQTYRGPAPVGMDIDYLRGNYWNAHGNNWGYTDVEYNWNQNHVDLGVIAGSVQVNGAPDLTITTFSDGSTADVRHHGSAVVGILSSGDNGFGTTGLVPAAGVRLSTEHTFWGTSRAAAISSAAAQFWKGTAILLEMQTVAGFDCNGDGLSNTGDLVPAEWETAVKDAVKTATANGRIVVGAAGNGNCNLDHGGFGGAFSTTDPSKDSGAILVGAGQRDTRDKEGFSTYGARVDVQGQGGGITTTGYGDLHSAEGYDRLYTAGFGGTSGASPMVTSVVVALAGVLWQYHGSVLDPREIRDLLRRDGTPQGTGGHIGPRPDLRKQVVHLHNRHVQMHSADFDGDGKDDYAVWRPSDGVWSIYYSGTGATAAYQWGLQGDIPVPANMTGDARTELVVWRPSNGTWYVRRWDGSSYAVQWGLDGDIPVPMDHDGNGLAEPTVWRPANTGGTAHSRWHIRTSDTTETWFDWGENGDTPLVGDFDADGRDDFAIFRNGAATWHLYHWSGATRTVQWGAWGDIPLINHIADRDHIAVWRPSNATFYHYNLVTNATSEAQWGIAGDIPRLADTDGNGTSERIVYRPSAGIWYNLDIWWGLYWGSVGDMAVTR